MFTASMIKYEINDETKTITASVDDIKYDAIETMMKAFRKSNINLSDNDMVVGIPCACDEEGNPCTDMVDASMIEIESYPMITCKKYMLPNHFEANAKYDENDPNPYSVARGKEIARRRLYNKYNKAYQTAMTNLMSAISDSLNYMSSSYMLTLDRITNFKYYEYYDIMKHQFDTSEKL